MAKRRAEDPLVHSPANKRGCAPLSAAVSAPSLSFSLGPRGGKRPHCFKGKLEESDLRRVTALCDCSRPENELLSREHCSTDRTRINKRPRRDCTESDTSGRKQRDTTDGDGGINSEDDKFNSFQYWRVPLPELDLSLLTDEEEYQIKDKLNVKDSSFDTMET